MVRPCLKKKKPNKTKQTKTKKKQGEQIVKEGI
jgi:hypothetical protein